MVKERFGLSSTVLLVSGRKKYGNKNKILEKEVNAFSNEASLMAAAILVGAREATHDGTN